MDQKPSDGEEKATPQPRKGQFEGMLSREAFRQRFLGSFRHPDFQQILANDSCD